MALGVFTLAAFALVGVAAASTAFAQSPWWHLTADSRPTDLNVGPGQIVVTAANLGDTDADANGEGEPVKIVDALPAGLTAMSIEAVASGKVGVSLGAVECSLESLTCTFDHGLPPFAQIEVRIGVAVAASASSGQIDEVVVSGGEAPSVSLRQPIAVGEPSTSAGVQSYELAAEEEGGAPATQAGSHPFQITLALSLDQTADALPVALSKDLRFKLPAGLIDNFEEWGRCSLTQFYATPATACSVVGAAIVTLNEPGSVGLYTITVPVYSLEPELGEPARLGFMLPYSTPVFISSTLRTGGDYGITLSVDNISQTSALLSVELTVGDAGSPHWHLPTSCTGPLPSTAEADFWNLPGSFVSRPGELLPALTGCGRLPFDPSIRVLPDGQQTATPTGITFEVGLPQGIDGTGLSESDVKDATFTLPLGMTLNPTGSEGLQECSPAQFALGSAVQPTCPNASKLATLEATTPLSSNSLMGAMYAGAASGEPFASPVPLYLAFEDPLSGILVKIAGAVSKDPLTGQLVVSFTNLPQLPFENIKLHLFGGERASLKTPPLCGSYAVTAAFAPWSGGPTTETSSTFDITVGRNDTTCKNAEEALKEEEEEAKRSKQEVRAANSSEQLQASAPSGGGGAAGFHADASPPIPDAQLASTALRVSPSGSLTVKVSCPAGETSCSGTITLRTLSAVSASAGRVAKNKGSILTLASGSFTVAGGKVATVKLHLSAKARALLARSHVLHARATIVAHDSAGASHIAQAIVTLRAAKPKHG